MKNIFINIILFLFFSSDLNAHISHYKNFKKIEMEIFRNNELIGYNYYFFKTKDDEVQVTNQTKITVKLLGATIFDVEGYGGSVRGFGVRGRCFSRHCYWQAYHVHEVPFQVLSGAYEREDEGLRAAQKDTTTPATL